MPAASVLLSIGSNLPARDARAAIDGVWDALAPAVTVTARSSVYESPAEGAKAVGRYANCVAQGHTALALDTLEHTMKAIEASCGRRRGDHADGCVPLDLDIVTYDGHVVRPKNLTMNYMRRGLAELGLAPGGLG